jgi:hypothetical protein
VIRGDFRRLETSADERANGSRWPKPAARQMSERLPFGQMSADKRVNGSRSARRRPTNK